MNNIFHQIKKLVKEKNDEYKNGCIVTRQRIWWGGFNQAPMVILSRNLLSGCTSPLGYHIDLPKKSGEVFWALMIFYNYWLDHLGGWLTKDTQDSCRCSCQATCKSSRCRGGDLWQSFGPGSLQLELIIGSAGSDSKLPLIFFLSW